MSLHDVAFKVEYDTNLDDDVLNNFYIPALAQTTCYRRMAGFFSSTALAVAAEGIESLILNNGRMLLLTSPNFSKEDLKIIKKYGSLKFGEILVDCLSRSIDSEFIENEHAEALGWMLSNGTLEIRIVIVKKDSEVRSGPMFHNKMGIMSDGTDTLAFSGSINESANGWSGNIENFDVFCDWYDPVSRVRVENKVKRFENYWKIGETEGSITLDIPNAVKKKWLKNVPENLTELKLLKKKNVGIRIRQYQKDAIKNWFDSGCRGLFNMATGTGKTITAIYALKQLLDNEKGEMHTIVIAVPFQHLIEDPWIKTLQSEIFPNALDARFIKAFGNSKEWRPLATNALADQRIRVVSDIIFVTTYDTLSSEALIEKVKQAKGKKILVADEVHNSGSSIFRRGLLEDYNYRMGLSATPARYLDDEGTEYISQYFGNEVYKFTLKRAIKEINPDTGKSYLTPYYYVPVLVSLNKSEIDDYNEYSSKIASFIGKDDLSQKEKQIYTKLLVNRSRIIKNAKSKLDTIQNLIPKLKEKNFLDFCLIYCSDGKVSEENNETISERTISKIVECLNRNGVKNRRFTSEENVEERKQILADFADGSIQTLVAIKCLDEGVDVPSTRNAVIMASTGNPREYIQRRGRILRRAPGKESATILDFVVIPGEPTIDINAETQILAGELKRFNEFSKHSLNAAENSKILDELRRKYNIEVESDD